MTTATDAPAFALVCRDWRRPQYGLAYRGLRFPSAAAAHAWVDRATDRTRATLVRCGYRVVQVAGQDPPGALLLCTPVGQAPFVPRGAETGDCLSCRRPVWVSPSTLALTRGFTRHLICTDCVPATD